MKYPELTRRLRRLGIRRIGAGKRHDVRARVDQQLRTVIPRHPAAEIPTGTLDRILEDLGLTRDDL